MKFLNELKEIVNTGQSRSVMLTGNIYDLFFDGEHWTPLIPLLKKKYTVPPVPGQQRGLTQVVMEINHPVEVQGDENYLELERIWQTVHPKADKSFKERLAATYENSAYAFEFLRQLTESSQLAKSRKNNLLIIVEGADLLLPESDINRLNLVDRRSIGIVQDWFSDPKFVNGHDTTIFIAETQSAVHRRIARLPQVLSVKVPLPSGEDRKQFIDWYAQSTPLDVDAESLANQTSGLSLYAINQLLRSGDLSPKNIAKKVEEYMVSQLGEGVVEFNRPTHLLPDCIGNTRLKQSFSQQVIPGFKAEGKDCLSGVAVAGPIGSGKTYICEAVAAEIGVPVITLKNIRSKWYGETDQIFERLRQLLESFHKVVIFVDEADTMFGGLDSDQDTERRLTGKIQGMMSDSALRGKVIWFLMTARIHRLSADIRRPGRMDMILPILDPEGEDRNEFIRWALGDISQQSEWHEIIPHVKGYSAAAFEELRKRIKREQCSTLEQACRIAQDIVPPDIEEVRQYQTLQAKLNCTRRSLLVDESCSTDEFARLRKGWKDEVRLLEEKGIN